jgi:alkylhydroperoxidase family enzyme
MISSTPPRIPPLPAEEWPDEVAAILDADLGDRSPLGAAKLRDLNLFTTAARLPRPFKPWLLLGRALVINGTLPFIDRELVILRVAILTRSGYEWGQHVRIAVDGGVPRAAIDRVAAGPGDPGWQERERLLMKAVDELRAEGRIGGPTWLGLAGHLDEKQLIELPMLVGYYTMVAYLLNSIEVVPEPGSEPLPAA